MSQQSPPRHFSNRPLYDGNHHYGRGPQHNGTKISNTNTQSGVHIWFDRHRTQVFATIALVAIVAIVSLGLGLGLGLRDNQDTPTANQRAASPGSSAPGVASPTAGQEVSQTSATTAPSTTGPVDPFYCDLGCEKAFVEEQGCHSLCPGAACRDLNDCLDPYPCIARLRSGTTISVSGTPVSSCCMTGCSESWTCEGACSLDLKCVSATNFTASSTCTRTGLN